MQSNGILKPENHLWGGRVDGLAMSRALGDLARRPYGVTSDWDVKPLELEGSKGTLVGLAQMTDGSESPSPVFPNTTALAKPPNDRIYTWVWSPLIPF